jgi:hypothetical protein
MRQYDPNDPNRPMIDDSLRRDEPLVERRSGMGSIGLMLALGFAIALGLLFWGMSGNGNRVADNTAPGVTTGSSTATPSPSNPPPAPGPKGQGESNSTR